MIVGFRQVDCIGLWNCIDGGQFDTMQQFSTYSGIWMHTPIEERICAIAEAGFDAVCLDFEKELVKNRDLLGKSDDAGSKI